MQVELLEKKLDLNDFGSDVIPWAVQNGLAVQALQIEGAWRDIGTVQCSLTLPTSIDGKHLACDLIGFITVSVLEMLSRSMHRQGTLCYPKFVHSTTDLPRTFMT